MELLGRLVRCCADDNFAIFLQALVQISTGTNKEAWQQHPRERSMVRRIRRHPTQSSMLYLVLWVL